MRKHRWWMLLLLAVVPITMLVLWSASGREALTKPEITRRMTVTDELFGDSTQRDVIQRGPIFGYFVGLKDAVAGSTATCFVLAAAILWLTRGRGVSRRRKEQT